MPRNGKEYTIISFVCKAKNSIFGKLFTRRKKELLPGHSPGLCATPQCKPGSRDALPCMWVGFRGMIPSAWRASGYFYNASRPQRFFAASLPPFGGKDYFVRGIT